MKKLFIRFVSRYKQEFFLVFIAGLIAVVAVPVITYYYFSQDIQTKEAIMNRKNTGVVLLDRNGVPFFTFYSGRVERIVPITKIPKTTKQAIIAAEDKNFYSHQGYSIPAIIRSVILDFEKKDFVYGGSTITQQLVKNSLLTPTKSFLRKYQELVLAREIERRYSKDEILEMYLNSVYFGEGAFGIEEAARTYFGKSASELSVAESALLAGVLPSPSRYSPLHGNKKEAIRQQQLVLSRMERAGFISERERRGFEKVPLVYASVPDGMNTTAPHFALMVRDELVRRFGEERISRSGFRVRTSLNLSWQKYAEKTVAEQVTRLAKNNVSNGAAVVIDPKTGEIRALVGSKNWHDPKFGKVNVALSPRPPGSSFKPVVYASAFEQRIITPATALSDRPTTFQGNYRPKDYDRRYRGTVLVRRALANSLNIPAVQVLAKIGIPSALEMAERLGVKTLKDPASYGLSLVLGTGEVRLLELTSAYGVFADHGLKHEPIAILTIEDKTGKRIFRSQSKGKRVLEPEVAFLISSILSDSTARRETFGNTLTISHPAAVKTGTTEDYKDAWTIGYTPDVVVGAWVGNNDNAPMDQVAGSMGAAPIWKTLMKKFSHASRHPFQAPSGIVQLSICRQNGYMARRGFSGKTEYFLTGTGPTQVCKPPVASVLSPTPGISPPPEGIPVPTLAPAAPTVTSSP